MVLNTHLIIIPTSNNIDTSGCINNYTHFAFKNRNNEYDLEKPLYDFLSGMLNRIDIEAANFADYIVLGVKPHFINDVCQEISKTRRLTKIKRHMT